MTPTDVTAFFARITDGQAIRVVLASGRSFDGIFDGENSDPAGMLHFETMEGHPLCAHWAKIETIDYRSARLTSGTMMVPPEHPLSGVAPPRLRADGTPLRAHTARNK